MMCIGIPAAFEDSVVLIEVPDNVGNASAGGGNLAFPQPDGDPSNR